MDVKLRKEGPEDTRTVECLLREAFWNVYVPGCEEHYLAHILRKHRDFVPELDLVAEAEGRLVGNVMCTHARIVSARETAWEMLCLGPLGVLPEYQQYGVGRILVERVTTLASEMGFGSIFLYGDPSYYRRLGFLPGEQFGIRNGEGQWAAALQGRELRSGALEKVEGRFLESEAFRTDPEAAARFDRTFPEREKVAAQSGSVFRACKHGPTIEAPLANMAFGPGSRSNESKNMRMELPEQLPSACDAFPEIPLRQQGCIVRQRRKQGCFYESMR